MCCNGVQRACLSRAKRTQQSSRPTCFATDENDVPESAEVLERLEKIDDETNSMDITFVKMADPRYARKWGVTKLPAVVYFRNKFPSVYRGKRLHYTIIALMIDT